MGRGRNGLSTYTYDQSQETMGPGETCVWALRKLHAQSEGLQCEGGSRGLHLPSSPGPRFCLYPVDQAGACVKAALGPPLDTAAAVGELVNSQLSIDFCLLKAHSCKRKGEVSNVPVVETMLQNEIKIMVN